MTTEIIKTAVGKLLSTLNPAGALVQLALTLYRVIKFFIDQWDTIKSVALGILNSIAMVALNKVGAAADFVEKVLAQGMKLIISFLARIFGLGGIANKVKDLIKKLAGSVKKVIAKVIDWIVKQGKKLFGKGKAAAAKAKEKLVAWWKAKKEFKTKDKKSHSLHFQGTGKAAKLILKSEPIHIGSWVAKKKGELGENQFPEKISALNKIQRVLMPEIKKITYPNPAKRPTMTIDQILADLAAQIQIIGVDGEGPVPRMLVSPGFSSAKADGRIEAKFIFKDKNNHQPGTPTTGKEDLHGAFTEINNLGVRSRWRRGHLINKDFGGKASNSNLIPIPESLNQGAFPTFDNSMRNLYNSRKVLHIEIYIQKEKKSEKSQDRMDFQNP